MLAIKIENVGKTYADCTALDNINLTVAQGKCLALIGHNGAGKTTLMKLMLGIARPTRGRVAVLGIDPASADKRFRSQLGFLPENVAFHDELTGHQTLAFYASLKGLPTGRCDELLERVGLSSAAGRRVKTYSKGMRQRLGLAQALLGEPRLLLLDEPTVGLDPVLRHEFFGILEELTAQGTTVILSSHILTELEARTDLVAILRRGRLVASGDLEQLRREANLSITIRANGDARAIAGRLNGSVTKTVGTERSTIEIGCPLAQKMTVLRALAELGDRCSNVEIHLPTLDDLYLHYSGAGAVGSAETEALS